MTPTPPLFALLLLAATWLAGAGLLVAWWGANAAGWTTLCEAAGAAGLVLWAVMSDTGPAKF